ncbi:hypothetical protein [Pseudarthrobacter albicanus]|uniref:hypothetical protein n=1 Tax=Pseudarthrobacter albicanus TaxID=2823873 RepID=UPI001BAD3ADF|nr:hypothetical protein [Pseudarthrobacter albicanus]
MAKNTRGGRPIRSSITRATPESVHVHGLDLTELLGKVNLGDFAFLELFKRLPDERESILINAMLVSLVEHGVTPSVIAARMTIMGAPESLRGAVTAGLLGLGNTFVGTIEGAARVWQQELPGGGRHGITPPDRLGDDGITALAVRSLMSTKRQANRWPALAIPCISPWTPGPAAFRPRRRTGFRRLGPPPDDRYLRRRQ